MKKPNPFFLKFLIFLALVGFSTANTGYSAHAVDKRPILFLIDISGSMQGAKIKAVQSAVNEIFNNLPPDQPVSLITFNKIVKEVVSPTVDRAKARAGLNSLKADGATSLYDAIELGLSQITTWNPSQLILLSDGADTSSRIKLPTLLDDVEKIRLPINSIGVQISPQEQKTLIVISSVSGGKYYNVNDISLLIATYKTILSEVISPKPEVPISKSPTPAKPRNVSSILRPLGYSITFAVLCFFFLIFLRQIYIDREQQKRRLAVLQKFTYVNTINAVSRLRASLISYAFVPKKFEIHVKTRLDLIHSNFAYEFVIRLLLGAWTLLTLLFLLVLGNLIPALIFATLLVPILFNVVTSNMHEYQKRKFAEELPELLNILASALRSGLSLAQGLEAYGADSKSEVARQIRRATAEIKVGTPIDEALKGVADRMQNSDLQWAVTALSIQRVVGGSMATILATTYETVRGRAEVRREVKTLSAEGKLSAYILMMLPIGIFSFLFLTRRDYVSTFYTTVPGIAMSIYIILSIGIGWVWIKKIVEIKV